MKRFKVTVEYENLGTWKRTSHNLFEAETKEDAQRQGSEYQTRIGGETTKIISSTAIEF